MDLEAALYNFIVVKSFVNEVVGKVSGFFCGFMNKDK